MSSFLITQDPVTIAITNRSTKTCSIVSRRERTVTVKFDSVYWRFMPSDFNSYYLIFKGVSFREEMIFPCKVYGSFIER